jgi:hypothetical protein
MHPTEYATAGVTVRDLPGIRREALCHSNADRVM